jgi:lysophospholipase L1-like esterase
VEIVSIMLGTNDSKVAENISIDDYTTNLETIINQLKLAGIKKIILNEPPYIISKENGGNSQWDNTSITKMTGYIAAIDPLVDGEQVLRGDTQAYAYFEANQTELPDKIHPNTLGHQHLGEFRASAIS